MKVMYNIRLFLLLFVFLLPYVSFSGKNTVIPDSLMTLDHIYQYTFSNPEKAYQIISLMREKKTEPAFKLDVAEGDLLYNNGKYNEAIVLYSRALESDSVQQNALHYMEQLYRMITCFDALHDEVNNAVYTERLLDKAEETGNREMRSVALFNMGKMIYYQADKPRGYQLINEAIEEMHRSDYRNKYHNLRYFYNILALMQQRDGLYEEALHTLDAFENILTSTTAEEAEIDGLDKKQLKILLAWRANTLSFLERMEEADAVYEQWKAVDTEYTRDDYIINTYLLRRKRFDEVIAIFKPHERFLYEQQDTVNYHMKSLKRLIGRAYEGKRDYNNAAKYYKELAVVTDSLKEREQRSSALELATLYETHKKELKLQEQATHIQVRNILLLSAGGVLLFLIIWLRRNIKNTQVIRRKNRLMAASIEEMLACEDELRQVKKELNAIKSTQLNISPDPERADPDIPEDQRLFEELDNKVIHEKLFLKPDLSRDDLMKLIHVNKNRFGQILQHYTGGTSTTYINDKRLQYAVRSLKAHPGYTIAAIAEMSGIPNIPTFNRLFKAKFGMTPTEFRDSL